MDISRYQAGQVRARGLADVSRGVHATAESFGGGHYRDLYNFGKAVDRAGGTMTEIANIKQERVDRTTVREEMTQLDNQYREWEKDALKNRKGMAAANLDKDGEKWFKERRREIEGRLKTQRQKDLFAPQFDNTETRAKQALFRYSFEQVEVGEKLTRDAQNDNFFHDSETRGLLNDTIVQDNRNLIHANIRANLQGQSDDVLTAAFRKADKALYTRMVDAHAARSLENALEYLERDDVTKALTPVDRKELADKLIAAKQKKDEDKGDTEAALYAIERKAEGAELEVLQEELIRKFGHDRGKLAYQEAVTRDNLDKAKAATAAQADAEARWETFEKTKAIPEGTPRKEKLAMLRAQNLIATGQKPQYDPWAFVEDMIAKYSPAQLQQMKRDGKWGEIFGTANPRGKITDAYRELAAYANGEGMRGVQSAEKYARNQYTKLTEKLPTGKHKQDYEVFIGHFNRMAEERAGELKLKNVNFLPRKEQESIIATLLEEGDWTSWNWDVLPDWDYLHPDQRRYQVMDNVGYKQYFIPKNRPAEAVSTNEIPGVGRRDTVDQRDGGVEITTPNGTIQQIGADGKTVLTHLPKPEPQEPEAPDEPEMPEFLQGWMKTRGSTKHWDSKGWRVSHLAQMYYVDRNGSIY